MSTLLKALRRAEQPRNAPYIPAMGLAVTREEERPRRWISWLLAPLALLLGAGANYGWHLHNNRPIEQKVEVKEVVTPLFVRVEPRAMITRPLPPPLPEPVVRPRVTPETSSEPKGQPSLAEQLMQAFNSTPLQEESAQPAHNAGSQLLPLAAAPASLQQQVPPLAYGSHLFSSNPVKRAVMLNGREYREGSEVAPGVQLSSIAQEYIVLQVAGQQVSLKALQDWRG